MNTPAHAETQCARFHPRRLAHSNLFVSSLATSVPFYRDVCGLSRVFDEPGIKTVFFSNGSSHHDVALMEIDDRPRLGRGGHVQVPRERGRRPGLNHLGFEMETEQALVDAYRRARAHDDGVSRTTDHGISHSVYIFDPDGNLLEFYADAVDDWRAFYASKENQLISGRWDPDASVPDTLPRYHEDFHPVPVENAPIRPRRIARATLLVSDLARQRRFYEDIVGLDPVVEGDDFVVFVGSLGEPAVALYSASSPQEVGLHHIGLELVDGVDMDELRGGLARAGVEVVAEFSTGSRQSVVIADPDGLRLEFFRAIRPGLDESPPDGLRRYRI